MNGLLLELKKRDIQMDFRSDKHTNGLLVVFTKGIYFKAHILDIEMLMGYNNELPLPYILHDYLIEFVDYIYEKEQEREQELKL